MWLCRYDRGCESHPFRVPFLLLLSVGCALEECLPTVMKNHALRADAAMRPGHALRADAAMRPGHAPRADAAMRPGHALREDAAMRHERLPRRFMFFSRILEY